MPDGSKGYTNPTVSKGTGSLHDLTSSVVFLDSKFGTASLKLPEGP